MTLPLTPGVHIRRVRPEPRPARLRTDIVGFIGIAERGPLHSPLRITSWRAFQDRFGGFLPYANLAYAVRAFYENGGDTCWVVRVGAAEAAQTASVRVPDESTSAATAYRVRAADPGRFANRLRIAVLPDRNASALQDPNVPLTPNQLAVNRFDGLVPGSRVRMSQAGRAGTLDARVGEIDAVRGTLTFDPQLEESDVATFHPDVPIRLESIEFTLVVFEDDQEQERLSGLAPAADAPHDAVRVVAEGSRLVRLERPDGTTMAVPATPFEAPLAGGFDALSSLTVDDLLGRLGEFPLRGLAALAEVDEVALLAAPDLVPADRSEPPSRQLFRPRLDPCDLRIADGLRTIAGRVRDAASGIPLEAVQIDDGAAVVGSDAAGRFTLADLPPGEVVPIAFARDGYEALVLPVDVDSAAERDLEVALDVLDAPNPLAEADIAYAQSQMIEQCERLRDRFALLDPPVPAADERTALAQVRSWRARFDSSFAALHYPWLRVRDPLVPEAPRGRAVPPSGHVAGAIAAADLAEGVHRPPANVALNWVEDVLDPVDDAEQAVLNPEGINAIRPFPGRGIRLFGARTLASPGRPDRFINVRRYLAALEEAIGDGLQWAVFEPNDVALRFRVALWLRRLLEDDWRRGALAGDAVEQAFTVRVDDVTTSADDRAAGRLIGLIEVAPVAPLEFILLRLGVSRDEVRISEV